MAQANNSIIVTAGSGETVANHLINGKKYQVVMCANESGHIDGSIPTWVVQTANSANVAAARTTFIDIFNASGSGQIIEIKGIYIIPTLAAVTGVGLTWEIIKTSAIGSGGSALTPRPFDSTNTALNANVTARIKPSGGATTNFILLSPNSSSEETIPYGSMASILNHVPSFAYGQGIYLREGEGLKVDQTTNSNVGLTNIIIVFVVE